MPEKNSHCSYCGSTFRLGQPWPRTCDVCGNTSYVNPLPVAVILVPVDNGLVVIRRGVAPRKGMLALPGGYISVGESWQAAGAREVLEETGIIVDPSMIRDFYARSAPDGTVLIFGLADARSRDTLPPFVPSLEASELTVIHEPTELAFPLHSEAARTFFER